MRRLYLKDAAPGDVVEDVFVITNKQLSATATGKHFVKAFLSDRTAQVTARMWNATRDLFNAMPESGLVRVRGRFENYQNNLQFIIEQVWPPKDGTFDIADLMPHTTRDIDMMCQRLFEICGSVKNRHLSAIVQAYLEDEELMNNFCRAPAAMNFHHAFIGGLLEHTLNAMEVADAVCNFYPGLNRDLVVVGIFLHDIAKTWELSYDCAFSYTDGGQLVGHVVKSAIWVEQKAQKAAELLGEPIPRPLVDVLQHIILSHHGLPEFGAARIPSTPEAIFVHTIENLDAKMMMSLSATRSGAAAAEGNWTEYMKAFNGRLYRPDVAPADDVETVEEPAPVSAAPVEPAPAPQPPAPVKPATPVAAAAPSAPPKLFINNPLFETVPARKK
ncbi:MAG: HD domain-containing protein [Tepidisphaeraceae bacterium]|jgi:3'-5' exoribonuclease